MIIAQSVQVGYGYGMDEIIHKEEILKAGKPLIQICNELSWYDNYHTKEKVIVFSLRIGENNDISNKLIRWFSNPELIIKHLRFICPSQKLEAHLYNVSGTIVPSAFVTCHVLAETRKKRLQLSILKYFLHYRTAYGYDDGMETQIIPFKTSLLSPP